MNNYKGLAWVCQVYNSHNEVVQNEVESYISRELRALGDVKIVDSNEFFKVKLIGIENATNKGVIGYTFSSAISKKSICLDVATIQLKEPSYYDCYVFQDLLITTTDEDGLKRMSERIVGIYDTNYLKPLRLKKRN